MSHRNARLTPIARFELVQAASAGWSQPEVARQFRVSRATVCKWVQRYRREGRAGLEDRSSAPLSSPRRVPSWLARLICALRLVSNRGPDWIGQVLNVPRATVYAVLRRAGLNRLSSLLPITRRPVRRYEHPAPGDLLHLDVKKLGRIPDGGGKRFAPGFLETMSGPQRRRGAGFEYLHVAIDDHSRVAYVELLPDEKGPTTAAFLKRAIAYFKRLGVRIRRILTDYAWNYTSCAVRAVTGAYGIAHKRTRPYRPQRRPEPVEGTNGKAEAFIKILLREWAYVRKYLTNGERVAALSAFMNYYNHHRLHGGIDGATPASRL